MTLETFLPWPEAAAVALDGMKVCPCGCGPLPATSRCRRARLRQRIDTLTRRLDGLRENRGTKGFRTTWEARERLREQLDGMPKNEHSSTTTGSIGTFRRDGISYLDDHETIDAGERDE